MQTSYDQQMAVGFPGMIADNTNRDVISRVNPLVLIPFGVGVCRGVNPDRDVKLPTTQAEAEKCIGIALSNMLIANAAGSDLPYYPLKSSVSVLRRGRVWVRALEAVTPNDDVYIRFNNGVADPTDTQKGGFGKISDGAAQVSTLTHTAVNSTPYFVDINGRVYSVTSSGSATPTSIVTQLKTAMAADPDVNVSGTATLVITAKVAGTPFTVSADSNTAVAATTPNAAAATRLYNARYMTTALENGLVILEVNFP